ncbi:3'-5' exonuclease [Chondrinema litorale]|uniref:3'-5' exonuclease n=1 Tax=Chondrinema litorale TaxID=2994555 RepID=UPI002543EDE8|nr:3'-5' exonuclease [Chondrinema litorale]UZR95465.1 3'-5' exonuclease [Chondrinema litorale]
MNDYLLFVDTETSGLPKDWDKPYSDRDNWPFIVQIAWSIYTKDGKEVKYENHFIEDKDYEILEASREIHGITHEFLQKHGKDRGNVMKILLADLKKYQPLVVSHFIQLDFHMLSVGFYRAGLENPLLVLPKFCTMQLTYGFVHYNHHKFLRLGELYQRLFNSPLDNQHNALADAQAVAKCFFELKRKGDITDKVIQNQNKPKAWKFNIFQKEGFGFVILILFILSLYIIHLL